MRPYPTDLRPAAYVPRQLRLCVDVPAGGIRVGGELDRSSAHHLADALSALRSGPRDVWTLDLEALSFCDVEGLRALHGARTAAAACGRRLHLVRVPGLVRELLPLLDARLGGAAGRAAAAVPAARPC